MSNYTLQDYQKDLKTVLSKSPHKPYERDDEGLVYFVDVIRSQYMPEANKAEFVTWLSLFIMIDLVFFTYYQEHYSALKEKFNTPKFEYGLTNTFIRPDDILIRLMRYVNINDVGDAFRGIVPEFNKMITVFANKRGVAFQNIQREILYDKDLAVGRFMMMYIDASGLDVTRYFRKVKKKITLSGSRKEVEISVLESVL